MKSLFSGRFAPVAVVRRCHSRLSRHAISNLPGWRWATIKQVALDRLSRSLHSDVCDSDGCNDVVVHSTISGRGGRRERATLNISSINGAGVEPREFFYDESFSKVVSREFHPIRRAMDSVGREASQVVSLLVSRMREVCGEQAVNDLFSSFDRRCSPLHYIFESKNPHATSMCQVLVEHSPQLIHFENDSVIGDQFSPLHHVARYRQHLPCLKELLRLKANPNVRIHTNGFTPLHFAASRLNYNACALLLSAKADPNATSTDGLELTPLHMLIAPWRYASCTKELKDGLSTYEVFLCFGADIHREDVDGRMPSQKCESLASPCGFGREDQYFSCSSTYFSTNIVNASPREKNKRRSVVEHKAADGTIHRYLVNDDFLKKLAKLERTKLGLPDDGRQQFPLSKDSFGFWNPLHFAVVHGHIDTVRAITDAGIDKFERSKDKISISPLELAKHLDGKDVLKEWNANTSHNNSSTLSE